MTNLEKAIAKMRDAIVEKLFDIDSGEETKVDFGPNISCNLLYNCLIDSCWKEKIKSSWQDRLNFISYWISPSGKEVTIEGSFWCTQNYVLTVC